MIETKNAELFPVDKVAIRCLEHSGWSGYIDKSTSTYNRYVLTKDNVTDTFYCLRRYRPTHLQKALFEFEKYNEQRMVNK